ncbi:hypothetical protein RHMOL_Rhmol05G0118000 [Rhododendron molle]|uniref:Uncharacterized protein n=1 Tax=Rhododendron molle TaxID=49168 RepID=A0ACC0NP70_RHOML|nr:hypothetical protein RHMOL_Rhmol05G0118000 [Rhododendron molle]
MAIHDFVPLIHQNSPRLLYPISPLPKNPSQNYPLSPSLRSISEPPITNPNCRNVCRRTQIPLFSCCAPAMAQYSCLFMTDTLLELNLVGPLFFG